MIWTVTKKELRGYFNSAVAVLFLAAFLVVTYYTFFWREKFFARGLADLRPLFEWMPRLLIIIVSALAMRLWAEEKRAGTLEILLTLPIPRWKLVVGKFVAGLMLVAVALGLTLGLPITISMMGSLDTGPVFGGYLAALLMAGAYLAIGMCVSAATDNQIVAFVGTAFLCSVAYAVGSDSGIGHVLGTGVHFESIARGVLDLRDLAYYGSIIAIGIATNVLLLERATWSTGPRARPRRVGAALAVGLVIANAVLLNVWLAPVHRARIDLTKDGAYSLSSSTKTILNGLDEQLLIRGYFSDKTHPKLAPLVPQIKDLLEEFKIEGGNKVKVEMVDPTDNEDLKREAKERFDISPTPFRFETNVEQSIVASYFNIALAYGDQHVVLDFRNLIQERAGVSESEVSLNNPEYAIMRAVKKLVAQFQSVDALFASLSGRVKLTAYVTPKQLPDELKDAPKLLEKVIADLNKEAKGKLDYESKTPTQDKMEELVEQGIQPGASVVNGHVQLYFWTIELRLGERGAILQLPQSDVTEAGLKKRILEAVKRVAPGFTRVVGMWSPPPGEPMGELGQMQRTPPPQSFQFLHEELSKLYDVRDIQLTKRVDDDIDVLLLAGPSGLDAEAVENIDQFVMRGGSLVVLNGKYRFKFGMGGFGVEKVKTGLEDVFKKWGITVGDELVLDKKALQVALPVGESEIGPSAPYPYWLRIGGGQLSSNNIITSALKGAVMHWATSVKADPKVGNDDHVVDELMTSSDKSWLSSGTTVQPNFTMYPDIGFPEPTPEQQKGEQVLAVAVRGGFASAVAPTDEKPKADGKEKKLLRHSPPDARVVVFGSSDFMSDIMVRVALDMQLDFALSNRELVQNAIDWTLLDTDLLEIRSHNSAARAITVDVDDRTSWRNANIVIAFVLCGIVVGYAYARRRSVRSVMEGA